MNNNKWHKLIALIVVPAIMFLYYNKSANWHYHITENGFVVEHAHPFSNSMIPETPFQDHEHSDAEYLFLAEMMQSLGIVFMILKGGARDHVVGEGVGVFYDESVFGDVVVPVC